MLLRGKSIIRIHVCVGGGGVWVCVCVCVCLCLRMWRVFQSLHLGQAQFFIFIFKRHIGNEIVIEFLIAQSTWLKSLQWTLFIVRSLGLWTLPRYIHQVSHYIRVKQRNIKSWDQHNDLVRRGCGYIRPLYNEVPVYYTCKRTRFSLVILNHIDLIHLDLNWKTFLGIEKYFHKHDHTSNVNIMGINCTLNWNSKWQDLYTWISGLKHMHVMWQKAGIVQHLVQLVV